MSPYMYFGGCLFKRSYPIETFQPVQEHRASTSNNDIMTDASVNSLLFTCASIFMRMRMKSIH